MKDKKILRDKDIIFEDFFIEYIEHFDLWFVWRLLRREPRIAIFKRDKWYIKNLNNKTLTFQLDVCLIKYLKKFDIREYIIILLSHQSLYYYFA